MNIDIPTVRKLIRALTGYAPTESDDILIELAIESRTDYVLSVCNREDLPKRLKSQLLRMIVGEFLYQKISIGGTGALGIETDSLVSSITEEDETVSFENSGDESGDVILRKYINKMRRGNPVTLQEYRRMKWPKY